MNAPAFSVKANATGSVIYHKETPLVIRKGLFCKMVGSTIKLESLDNAMVKELVRLAYETQNESRDSRKVLDRIEKLGQDHCFRVHRGFVYDSMALFEQELNKL